MKRVLLGVVLAALTAVTGFGQMKLGGVRWELVELNGRAAVGSKAYLEFDENAKRLSGNAGCNRLFGSYEMDGKAFKTGPLGTTKMACLGGVAMRERAFLKAVGEADAFELAGATLTLTSKGQPIARFRKAGGAAGLEAKKWLLVSVDGKPVKLAKGAAYISFDSGEGKAGGNSGCNSFGGGYEVSGDAIKFTDLVSTMMACGTGDRMDVERRFMDALQNADRFEVAGGKLKFMTGERIVLEFEGADL